MGGTICQHPKVGGAWTCQHPVVGGVWTCQHPELGGVWTCQYPEVGGAWTCQHPEVGGACSGPLVSNDRRLADCWRGEADGSTSLGCVAPAETNPDNSQCPDVCHYIGLK